MQGVTDFFCAHHSSKRANCALSMPLRAAVAAGSTVNATCLNPGPGFDPEVSITLSGQADTTCGPLLASASTLARRRATVFNVSGGPSDGAFVCPGDSSVSYSYSATTNAQSTFLVTATDATCTPESVAVGENACMCVMLCCGRGTFSVSKVQRVSSPVTPFHLCLLKNKQFSAASASAACHCSAPWQHLQCDM
jgi:hypothetical protein